MRAEHVGLPTKRRCVMSLTNSPSMWTLQIHFDQARKTFLFTFSSDLRKV